MQVLNLPEVGESLWAWVSDIPGVVVGEEVWSEVLVAETADVVVAPAVVGPPAVGPPAVELVVEPPPLQP